MSPIRVVLIVLLCVFDTSAQHPAEFAASRTLEHSAYRAASLVIEREYDRFVDELIELTEIPAPPFKEDARADAFMRLARASGFVDVEKDEEGNVLAFRPGSGGLLLVVAAHLDTVFPDGTDVTVRRDGSRLSAPGIGDDAQGVASLLALARAMNAAAVRTTSDILFVANVGEEGSGALRGVRHLFTKGHYRDRIRSFISIDGPGNGDYITTGGVGSKRYRVTFSGPGGHSYSAFGIVNPANALAAAIQHMAAIPVPRVPKTTFNVGTIGGGTSVNTIPSSAWMDVDLRSESPDELEKLNTAFQAAMARGVADENRMRSTSQGAVTLEAQLVGDRPSGSTAPGTALVQATAAAIRATGLQPVYGSSSTDANLPMSLGIPAITIDTGLRGGRAHAPDEWLDVAREPGVRGLQRALLIVLSVAGVE
jgi:acetylornithine deacetylase/succinyl-diaminopimelate desuccinylase-like protein